MKNLYPKSKGKIYPSPAAPSAAGGGGGGALSVLELLPAAIFVMTAALSFEDKEVVAYLMIRSIKGSEPAADAAEERRRWRRTAGVHSPLFDCGCFDCYTSFWSRWDCSGDREVIHMAIEAFEEHLASKEKEKKGKEAKRKRKKSKDEKKEKEKEKDKVKEMKDDEKMAEVVATAEESKCFEEAVSVSNGCFAEEKEHEVERDEGEEAEEEVMELPAVNGEKRRGWADVMGMFNSRLWSLWSPGV